MGFRKVYEPTEQDLVPDPLVAAEFGVSLMTLWRWSHLDQYAHLKFPPPIKIANRNYRNRGALDSFKKRLAKAVAA